MARLFQITLSVLIATTWGGLEAVASPNCPIQGAEFPKPRQLSEQPSWKAALAALITTFESVASVGNNYSFSVQVFSTNPGAPIVFESYHTAQDLPKNTTGVKKVDADTVYRLGSVTKIFTVLAFLAEVGDKYFNHPIGDFVPEIAELKKQQPDPNDKIRTTDWDDITIISLMTQMSGLERDRKFALLSWKRRETNCRAELVLGEVLGALSMSTAVDLGFPPLAKKDVPVCGNYPLCNRTR